MAPLPHSMFRVRDGRLPGTFRFAISPGGEITGFYDDGINASSRLPAG